MYLSHSLTLGWWCVISHWYSPTGQLLDRVEYKDPKRRGFYRDATLADARPLGYYPSVTTILGLLNKPALTKWQVRQGIKAASLVDWGELDEDGMEASYEATYQDSEAYTRWTADYGTATHWWLNKLIRERQGITTWGIPPIMPGTQELAEASLAFLDANGFEFTHTERTVVDPVKGFAGTVDLLGTYYGEPCLVDLKTQSQPLTAYDPEHALQLVAYDELLGEKLDICGVCGTYEGVHTSEHEWTPGPKRKLISLIADRDNTGQFKLHEWTGIDRYREMWQHLLQFWFLQSKYDPREAKSGTT